MRSEIRVLGVRGMDVPNFFKAVPMVPMFILGQGTTSNHFPKVRKGSNGPWEEI